MLFIILIGWGMKSGGGSGSVGGSNGGGSGGQYSESSIRIHELLGFVDRIHCCLYLNRLE